MRFKWLMVWATVLLGSMSASAAGKSQVEVLSGAESAKPGDTVWVGFKFGMPFGWHIYWRNSGTTGIPTKIAWQNLPEEIKAGPIEWPVPSRRVTPIAGVDEISYDYEDELVLLVPFQIKLGAAPGKRTLSAKVSWLECKTDGACIPGKAEVSVDVNIGDSTKPSGDAKTIEDWRGRLPSASGNGTLSAFWDGPATLEERPFVIEWKGASKTTAPDFFAYESDAISVHPANEVLASSDGTIRLRRKASKLGDNWPGSIAGLAVGDSKGSPAGGAFQATIPISQASATTATSDPIPAAPKEPQSSAAVPPPSQSPFKMLIYAFLGGLILNVMPCVLPVIALKILGFVNQSKDDPKRVFHMGLIYAAGVVFSFLVLAGLIIAVKQAGQSAGWGMQFANPKFLVFMTVLVLLVALNLFGLFEVNLGGSAMDAASGLSAKEGPAGAFFQGMLATALATPCTAPFLAPALGFAFAQSAGVIVLMFATIAAGLAFPYVLLSWQPTWLKFLPKPGVWMQHFKVAMGFPMLATSVWLFWLTEKHYGRDGVLWFGIFLVVVSLGAWVWGQFVQRGSSRQGLAMVIAAGLLVGGYAYAMEGQLHWRESRVGRADINSGTSAAVPQKGEIDWRPWSRDAVAKARSDGRPILVDFTADWCLTCNVNKKTSIEIASVKAKLDEIRAVTLLGDHTLQPPAITAELQKFGRAGVPLVLVYPKDASKPPIVLPEVLAPGIVLDALAKAAE